MEIPRVSGKFRDRNERATVEGLLRGTGATVAVYGLPGVGKTALAARIASGVSDGEIAPLSKALWANFGHTPDQPPDTVSILREWCQELAGDVPSGASDEVAQLRRALNSELARRPRGSTLFTLDGIGPRREDMAAVRECYIESPAGRYLMTTVSRAAAVNLTGDTSSAVHLPELGHEAARALLESYADNEPGLVKLTREDWEYLLRLAGGLPLALRVLGNMLGTEIRRGRSRSRILGLFSEAERVLRDQAANRLSGGSRSISVVLRARWDSLFPEQQKVWQTAAIFREKPDTFPEAALAAVYIARNAADDSQGRDVARAIGEAAGNRADELGIDADTAEDLAVEDDATVKIECEDFCEIRSELTEAGVLEQPIPTEQRFTVHSVIALFLENETGLEPGERHRMHMYAAEYYQGWLKGVQDSKSPWVSSFRAAHRFENRRWLAAMTDLCYHLRDPGDDTTAALQLTTLYFDAFWWWGEFVRYQFCTELLRLWEDAGLGGATATACLEYVHEFSEAYPIAVDIDAVPPADSTALPLGYRMGGGDPQRIKNALHGIRGQLRLDDRLDAREPESGYQRLGMLTSLYLGQAHAFAREAGEAESWFGETLRLLDGLGEDDAWNIPYIHAEIAEVRLAAGLTAEALSACDAGTSAALDDWGEKLWNGIDDDDIDHEVLGWLWRDAGDAHWLAGDPETAWHCYAWACFHGCALMLWPVRSVSSGPGGELEDKYGADDYTCTFYKLQLALVLQRLGELWAGQRYDAAASGLIRMRGTLWGGNPRAPEYLGDHILAGLAGTPWEHCQSRIWMDDNPKYPPLPGFFDGLLDKPLVPWVRLNDPGEAAQQQADAEDMAARLKAVWEANAWRPESGPGR